jgi:ankyrin repeat protein
LYWASTNGNQNIVEFLIDNKGDVDVHDDRGWSALDQAVAQNHTKVVDMLTEAGAH